MYNGKTTMEHRAVLSAILCELKLSSDDFLKLVDAITEVSISNYYDGADMAKSVYRTKNTTASATPQ